MTGEAAVAEAGDDAGDAPVQDVSADGSTAGTWAKCGLGKRVAVQAMRILDPRQGQALFGPTWASKLLIGKVIGVDKRSRFVCFDIEGVPDSKVSSRFLSDVDKNLDSGLFTNGQDFEGAADRSGHANSIPTATIDSMHRHQVALPSLNAWNTKDDLIKLAGLESDRSSIINASADEKAAAYEKLVTVRAALKLRINQIEDLMAKIQECKEDRQPRISDLAASQQTQLASKLATQQWVAMQQWSAHRFGLQSQLTMHHLLQNSNSKNRWFFVTRPKVISVFILRKNI
jgi:hypothetical protein